MRYMSLNCFKRRECHGQNIFFPKLKLAQKIIFAMCGPHRNHQQHSIGTGRGPQRSNQNMAPSQKRPLKVIQTTVP